MARGRFVSKWSVPELGTRTRQAPVVGRQFVSLTQPSGVTITPEMRIILIQLSQAGNGITVGFDDFARIVNTAGASSPALHQAGIAVCRMLRVRVVGE